MPQMHRISLSIGDTWAFFCPLFAVREWKRGAAPLHYQSIKPLVWQWTTFWRCYRGAEFSSRQVPLFSRASCFKKIFLHADCLVTWSLKYLDCRWGTNLERREKKRGKNNSAIRFLLRKVHPGNFYIRGKTQLQLPGVLFCNNTCIFSPFSHLDFSIFFFVLLWTKISFKWILKYIFALLLGLIKLFFLHAWEIFSILLNRSEYSVAFGVIF